MFEVVSRAYERTSLIITTNLPFEAWTEVLGSERLTGALLDREGRARERRIKAAGFPGIKTLDSFDFAAQPQARQPRPVPLTPVGSRAFQWGWMLDAPVGGPRPRYFAPRLLLIAAPA